MARTTANGFDTNADGWSVGILRGSPCACHGACHGAWHGGGRGARPGWHGAWHGAWHGTCRDQPSSRAFTLPVYLPWIHRASTVRLPCKYHACAAPLPRKQVDNCALEQLVVEHLQLHAAAASNPKVLMVEGRLFSFQHG